jgi:hypothetical protein
VRKAALVAVQKLEKANPQFDAMQYDGKNATEIDEWAAGYDDTGQRWWTKVDDAKLFVRLPTDTWLAVQPGSWVLASTDGLTSPPVFMQEADAVAKRYKPKGTLAVPGER